MALFGLFESKKGEQETQQRQTKVGTTKQKETQRGTQKTEDVRRTTQLGSETVSLLEQLVATIGEGVLGTDTAGQAKQAAELQTLFGEKAKTAEEDIQSQLAPILSEAERKGQRDITSLQTQLAQQAGGSLANTFVTAATSEAQASLQSQLASLASELNLKAREQGQDEIAQAVELLAQGPGAQTEALTALVESLRGAETVQTGTQEVTSQQVSDLVRTIDELIKGSSESETKESGFSLGFK